ncbi:hypothetical protein WH96_20125 [Kiloniella spongiae]|uniref:Uncharacterized protein n=2 Tax=Kiloniella spongiae TaxID=1489064 RepID=A0A0H2MEB5_9PROT|nr:hypothetical protein WH96_20125 [Kiloniella spongiae]
MLSKILISSPILSAIFSIIFFHILSSQFFYNTAFFEEIKVSWIEILSLQDEEYNRNLNIINDYILFHTLCLFFTCIFIVRSFFYEWPFIKRKFKDKYTLSLLKSVCFGSGKKSSIWGLVKYLSLIYFGIFVMAIGSGAIFYGGADDVFYNLFEVYRFFYYLVVSFYISLIFILLIPFTPFISILTINEFILKERSKSRGNGV